jgi:hypothetical protein
MGGQKLKKKKTKFKIYSSPLTLSLSKFTDSLSLSLSLSLRHSLFPTGQPSFTGFCLSLSPALPLPGRSAVLHRIPSPPVGRPFSSDSVSTSRHLSLSPEPFLFTGEDLSPPARPFPPTEESSKSLNEG